MRSCTLLATHRSLHTRHAVWGEEGRRGDCGRVSGGLCRVQSADADRADCTRTTPDCNTCARMSTVIIWQRQDAAECGGRGGVPWVEGLQEGTRGDCSTPHRTPSRPLSPLRLRPFPHAPACGASVPRPRHPLPIHIHYAPTHLHGVRPPLHRQNARPPLQGGSPTSPPAAAPPRACVQEVPQALRLQGGGGHHQAQVGPPPLHLRAHMGCVCISTGVC